MKNFAFDGEVPASKSLLNRALIIQSFFPELQIDGESTCDDVNAMRSALVDFGQKKEIFCHDAGTVLRFMSLRVSREPGTWKLTGSPRLLSRPHLEVIDLLRQLGVASEVKADHILVRSEGWKKPKQSIQISLARSSQFASGLLLSSWNLPFELNLQIQTGVSESYLQMTLQMMNYLGVPLKTEDGAIHILGGQRPSKQRIKIESDLSSAFPILVAGALAGTAKVRNITRSSSQPDAVIFDIFEKLGAKFFRDNETVTVSKSKFSGPMSMDIGNTPDLFPVLAVLCSFVDGTSKLWGAPQLVYKESNRIQKTQELLQKAGIHSEPAPDGMIITGQADRSLNKSFSFDADHDHRMAFAAGILKLMGADIKIYNSEVVSKSFPQFWQCLGVNP